MIGVGGLGHVAVQILKAISPVRVVAVDVGRGQLQLAADCGADAALESGPDTAAEILGMTGGRGADVVLDFVGVDATAQMSVGAVAPNGAYRMIGLGGGTPGVTAEPAGGPGWPWGASVRKSYGGTRSDLIDVIELAKAGKVTVATEEFPLREARAALHHLEAGKIRGRAVLVP